MPSVTFSYENLLCTLAQHEVEYILIGGICANLHGVPVTTFDLDIVPRREARNLSEMRRVKDRQVLPLLLLAQQEQANALQPENGESSDIVST